MIRAARIFAALLLLAGPATAQEEVVMGLSQDEVAITTAFDGSNILIFGAIRRETPIPEVPIDVIVAIEGPSTPLTVRRKDRKFGIWVNDAALNIRSAPSFYAVATTGPLDEVLLPFQDRRYDISVPRAIRAADGETETADTAAFVEALIRIRTEEDLYQHLEGAVTVDQDTLFQTEIALPANLTEGRYRTRIFLVREGKVISYFQKSITVRKVGLERFLFNLSRQQPLIYGLMSLAIAVIAGWAASAAFRLLQRN
ncbi:TIGR02186 family protein [Mesobacterium pallidum]|uniref:TIGR02186 family protein n=1 Tax=Mesobacterium pallidum TaxID=2872037 RepID=UPI001EE234B6|nr:TIGR02186 family protein [Mesobacterium pallidum]